MPARIHLLDGLPLTPSGKIDRRALPKPAHEGSQEDGAYVAPRNAVEEMLAGI